MPHYKSVGGDLVDFDTWQKQEEAKKGVPVKKSEPVVTKKKAVKKKK